MASVDALILVAVIDGPSRRVVQHLHAQPMELKARGRTIVAMHIALDAHGRFAPQVPNLIGQVFAQRIACEDHLYGRASVAHFDKSDTPPTAPAFYPAFNGDGLTLVGRDLCYADGGA